MGDEWTLGIDIGTTAVKAGIVNQSGDMDLIFAQNYQTDRPAPAFVEQDPDDWTRLLDKAVASIDAKGLRGSISSLGLCSQVNTHVFLDADAKPLMPAILWQDGRAAAEAAELEAKISDEQKLAWWGTPMPIDASHVLPRMLWVSRNRPDIWEKTRWVLLPKDYCIFHLTGEISTDPISNIGLVDNNLQYIPDLLALVAGAGERMARLVSPLDIVAPAKSTFAIGGIPVISGTMDAWAGLVGSGGAKAGSTMYLSGTSEILGISSPKVVPTKGAIVFPKCCDIRLHAGPTQSGGDARLWFSTQTGLPSDEMSQLVSDTPRSRATPLFLPQLEGERAPLWDANLRASFIGMSRRTTLGDLARAVYEGVAFSARHALEALQQSAAVTSQRIICGGGGFRSTAWGQIRSDILGCELHVLAAGEPGILGAAITAAIGSGKYSGFEEAGAALARCDRVFTPQATARAQYSELFEIYKQAIDANAVINAKLSRISAGC